MTDRPTFSESWSRVADLRPRLRTIVQVSRQQYRGRTWHVITDPTSNEYFRLDSPAYYFLGLLDGERSVARAWARTQEQLGDAAPTQGEAIHLLGRLYVCNLIQADLPPDAAGMFDRLRKRRRKEIGGRLVNLLFVRLPIFDPDRILDRWVRLFGWVFSKAGVVFWILLILAAMWRLLDRLDQLRRESSAVLNPANLVWLSLCFWGLKLLHEFGHAFACKKFGQDEGRGGEVHTMGFMLVAMMPLPYVDATSAWGFRNKWRRIAVGAAGMYVELAIAAGATLVWAATRSTSTLHQLAYNIMFLASVSTVLFNGNPLMRYDAYYMLCDYMESPNLANRSRDYLYYLVKKYIFGVKKMADPAHGDSERRWFAPYAVASSIYRIMVSVSIMMFVAGQLFIVGVVMALAGLVSMVLAPTARLIHYLTSNHEIARVRARALGLSLTTAIVLLALAGLVPVSDSGRAQGVVEPRKLAMIHMATDGFVQSIAPSGQHVKPGGEPLVAAHDPSLHVLRKKLLAQRDMAAFQQRDAESSDAALSHSLNKQIEVLDLQLAQAERRIASLTMTAPIEGQWIASDTNRAEGAYFHRGQAVGMVASFDDMIIRVAADQNLGPRIEPEIGVGGRVDIRVQGRPDIHFQGVIDKVLPAGQQRLPSKALSAFVGGLLETDANDQSGAKTTESFFEVHVTPDWRGQAPAALFTGQRVIVRFEMTDRPILFQAWRSLRQLLQQRFQV